VMPPCQQEESPRLSAFAYAPIKQDEKGSVHRLPLSSDGLLRGCSYQQHKCQPQVGGRAVLRTSKSVSGALDTIGGVAGVRVLVVAAALIFH
jgi:hypothetical protein